MQVKSPGLKGGSVKVLLAMRTEYETDENVETVIVKKMLHILDQGEKWVFVLDRWVFVLDQWVFVLDQSVFVLDQRVFVLDRWVFALDQWVFVLDHRVLGFGSSFSTHPFLGKTPNSLSASLHPGV